MPYDQSKDNVLENHIVELTETTWIVISVCQYDGGRLRIRMSSGGEKPDGTEWQGALKRFDVPDAIRVAEVLTEIGKRFAAKLEPEPEPLRPEGAKQLAASVPLIERIEREQKKRKAKPAPDPDPWPVAPVDEGF